MFIKEAITSLSHTIQEIQSGRHLYGRQTKRNKQTNKKQQKKKKKYERFVSMFCEQKNKPGRLEFPVRRIHSYTKPNRNH